MDVLSVIRQGKRSFGGLIDIVFLKRRDQNPSEAKVVVSQKVAKKAVDRHKIQRRLREIVRHAFPAYPHAAHGYDMVVMARPPAKQASFDELRTTVHSILSRL
jgi:ribonuclease P protein component